MSAGDIEGTLAEGLRDRSRESAFAADLRKVASQLEAGEIIISELEVAGLDGTGPVRFRFGGYKR